MRIFISLLLCVLQTTAFYLHPQNFQRSVSPIRMAVASLESMTVPQLKELLKSKNPERGLITKLKRKQDLIDYLQGKSNTSTESAKSVGSEDSAKSAKTTESAKKPVKTSTPIEKSEKLSSKKAPITSSATTSTYTKAFPEVLSKFPGALTNKQTLKMIKDTLEEYGYDLGNTLVATSLCCDEVNRPLESDLSNSFDTNFNMGGLAGFPFGGKTSFGAMAAHIPDGGSCLVVYGPHVGIDSTGEVGTVERRGRKHGGSCCGSAVAAAGFVSSVYNGKAEEAAFPTDVLDAQQHFVGSMLMPYADLLEEANEKMVELPYALYDAQTKFMERIVTESGGAVAGEGTIAVLGGVQINTPPGYTDYYLPLSFKLFSNQGELIKDLTPTPYTAPFTKVKSIFPDALTNAELVTKVSEILDKNGYDKEKTLVATSLCCDEVNRPLETSFSSVYDTNFNMGGLAGFPFGGATSFGAMAAHIPDGGSCLVVYGPHVGVDSSGTIGTVERRGRENGGSCCGSAVAAAGYVSSVFNGAKELGLPEDALDAQQYFVGSMFMPHAERLENADNKMIELPFAIYDSQSDLIARVIGESCGAVSGKGTIAVLGGIQINTPPGLTDYYLPLSFELYNNEGELLEDLMWD